MAYNTDTEVYDARVKKIVDHFPEQFGELIKRFGISLPLGWLTLWENICLALKVELENMPGVQIEWQQVKEKFGMARLYFEVKFSEEYNEEQKEQITNKLYDIVLGAENASANICQDCGQPGKLRGGNWIRTLCDEHAKERGVL